MAEPVAWVTGASYGLGRALALALARRGRRVAISARGADGLAALAAMPEADGRLLPFPLDITDRESVASTVRRIEAEAGPIDLAVLNAGTHEPMFARGFDAAAVERLARVNLLGTAHCLEALLPPMMARRGGRIAAVASVAGLFGLPGAAAYGATKAGLIAMLEALKPELDLHGVRVHVINPGFVDTPLTRKNEFPMPFLMTPEVAAARIVRGLGRDAFLIEFPRRLALMLRMLRLLPYPLAFRVTRRLVPSAVRP